jgi:hypothetical protein
MKHELQTRGLLFKWDDDDRDYSKERSLLGLYDKIGNIIYWGRNEKERN